MKIALIAIAVLYASGFLLVLWMHTQMPATFGLALARSALWPISIVVREFVPRGTPLRMD